MSSKSRVSRGTSVGLLGSGVGVLLSLVIMFLPLGTGEVCTIGGECTPVQGAVGIDYLLGVEGAEPILFFWSVFILGFALLGGYGAWRERRILVWVAAIALLALTVFGLASIGLLVAPAALLFLLAGFWLRETQPPSTTGRSIPRS
ncbi:hypothetical protein [Haladaptatus sp. DJG-WS-42]|uniref:hypothetical protein n=1 Tax=Haladaptatus sp. DJG-WS-42 TaxID=3120516 RepID=UPI0030D5E8A4